MDDDKMRLCPSVVALGNFDGLHVAHMQIIKNSTLYGKQYGIQSGVLLFDRHASGKGHIEVPLITTITQKLAILENAGVDFVYITRFNTEFMNKTPEEFILLLKNKINIKAVCVGYDYRFGHKALGDIHMLRRFGDMCGFDVLVSDAIMQDGQLVGSTYIRKLVQKGDMKEAFKMLGRRFSIYGEVVRGLQNGRKMGFATANIAERCDMVVPEFGVYVGYVVLDGNRYKAVINVGKNPTFKAEHTTIESHILDFDKDIYGETITVEFVEKIRGDKKFSSIDELKLQIQKDVNQARELL